MSPQTFTLPAGCRMRITVSMEPNHADRHSWSLALYPIDAGPAAEPHSNYGSLIGGGQTHRIDAPPFAADSRCEIASTHETPEGWETDLAEVTLDTPDDLSIAFYRPSSLAAEDLQRCVMAIEFSPAIRAAATPQRPRKD